MSSICGAPQRKTPTFGGDEARSVYAYLYTATHNNLSSIMLHCKNNDKFHPAA
jgi:hypothetical protein